MNKLHVNFSDELAEYFGVSNLADAMLQRLKNKRATGAEKYRGFHQNPDGMTTQQHNEWLQKWLQEKVNTGQWVDVANLAMMLYNRQTLGINGLEG
jgi:hypothetical protein